MSPVVWALLAPKVSEMKAFSPSYLPIANLLTAKGVVIAVICVDSGAVLKLAWPDDLRGKLWTTQAVLPVNGALISVQD
jgi:hypothetical protein